MCMNTQFLAFLESLKDDSTDLLLESITEAYSVLFEEPHIMINGDKELHNNVPVSELAKLLKNSNKSDFNQLVKLKKDLHGKKSNYPSPTDKSNAPLDIPSGMDYFDLYMEETGRKREDGKIHEPIRYINDIYRGKLVISPRTNTPIKLDDKQDRELFMDSLSSNYFTATAIIQYLLDDKYNNPNRGIDKAGLLPDKFYSQFISKARLKKNAFHIGDEKTDLPQAIEYLKPKPTSMHESK